MPRISTYKKLRITHEILADLERSEPWKKVSSFSSLFTSESIYGPEGKLNWLWNKYWDSEESMKNDLYANMGGGVPIEIIEELIRITTTNFEA